MSIGCFSSIVGGSHQRNTYYHVFSGVLRAENADLFVNLILFVLFTAVHTV